MSDNDGASRGSKIHWWGRYVIVAMLALVLLWVFLPGSFVTLGTLVILVLIAMLIRRKRDRDLS